jgi:LysM repeat protein/mono/diheme cytochrome c family protein
LNTQKQIVLIVALLFIFTGGCAAYTAIELPVRAPDQADWTRDQSLERGALLFANNCRTCHGNKGQGGVGPQLLNAEQSQFQDQDPLRLRANRDLLQRTLACGRAGTLMPAWLNTNGGALNAIQVQHLVNFLSAPIEVSDDGEATSHWWEEAEHFAHNLNAEVAVLISGDTLGTIAKAHGIGPRQLAEYNNLPIEGNIKKGTEVRIPGFRGDENGYTYTVYKSNETMAKIAESQHVGAIILADLNNIPYDFEEKRGVATLQLETPEGQDVAGLFPGQELRLPEGATYTITAGDTIEAIAERHGISISALTGPNGDVFDDLEDDEEVPFERRLELPRPVVIVQTGDTLAAIADAHGLELPDLAASSGLAEDAVINPGQEITLPSDAEYVVQAGDTWAIAASIHGTDAATLAQANDTTDDTVLSPDVIIELPNIDGYVVQGQSLEDAAGGYGNVTASSLADANGVQEDTVLAIGTQLVLPDDAFGSAPPDAINPGTACVQYAVTASAFECVVNGDCGGGVPVPEEISTSVQVEAHANDWTVTADGEEKEPNAGAAKILVGTVVNFASIVGLHNITINGETEGEDINTGDTRDITFNDPGDFEITCSYHPDMFAALFVVEEGEAAE